MLLGPVPDFSKNVNLKDLQLYGNSLSGKFVGAPNWGPPIRIETENEILYFAGSVPGFAKNIALEKLYLDSNYLEGGFRKSEFWCPPIRAEIWNFAF